MHTMQLDETHHSSLTSWVESANDPETEFPIQNLPLGIFRRKESQANSEQFRAGVAIGNQILDIAALASVAMASWLPAELTADELVMANVHQALTALKADSLNHFLQLGYPTWRTFRRTMSAALRSGCGARSVLTRMLVPQAQAEYALPTKIGDYTDFFTSYHHMINVGKVMAPNAPPMPNFKWLPVAYHGRASSVAVSGTDVFRPRCQAKSPDTPQPTIGPSTQLDYEFEFGAIVGNGNALGASFSPAEAEQAIFGLCVLNDWSARDIQAWESMPLGPFLSKNFLTTLSPWVVSMDALRPFRVPLPRSEADPEALEYLRLGINADGMPVSGGIDIHMEAWLTPQDANGTSFRLSRSNFKHCYWSLSQMVTHHTSNGCNLNAGDLIGTGTQSGPQDGEQGCLIELTQGGKRPLMLAENVTRTYLQDGDQVQLKAWCESSTHRKIGFGNCIGRIQPVATTGDHRQINQ